MILLFIFTIVASQISIISSLDCYFCQSQSQDSCYYASGTLPKRKCEEPGTCIAYEQEVVTRNGEYTKTFRGCHNLPDLDACSVLMREVKQKGGDSKRGRSCRVCRENLCNGAARLHRPVALLVLVVLRKAVA